MTIPTLRHLRLGPPAAVALAALAAACSSGSSSPDAGPIASATSAPSASPSAAPSAPKERPRAVVREGGALARGVGEEVLYVADEEHKMVRRVPLPLDEKSLGVAVAVPGPPAAVLPLADRVLVTVRDPGLLLIMKPDAEKGLVEAARVPLPADAWGVAVTPDEKTALVTSAWTHQLSAVDLDAAKKRWSIDLPREPRAVVVRADGAGAYVTHLTGGVVSRVDDLAGSPKARAVDLPPAPARAPSGKTLDASLAYSAVLSDDGARLFVPRHALGALGQGSWFGATTVDVLATGSDVPLIQKRVPGLPMARHPLIVQMIDAGLVTNFDTSGADLQPIVQPRAALYRRSTKTILVAGEGDDRVAEFDALSAAPAMRTLLTYKVGSDYDPHLGVARKCGAPSGLALSADESTLYVYCKSTFDLAMVKLVDPNAPGASDPAPPKPGSPRRAREVAAAATVHLADDPLDKEGTLGRRLFHNALDEVVSGGLACAGCHPEGRDDGHVWHEAKVTSLNESERTIFIGEPELAPNAKGNVIGYARQTPMLAGHVGYPGPYGWHAQNADLVERLKEGFGLHRWTSVYRKEVGEQLARIQYIRAYLFHGLVNPPREERELTAEERRGKEIFMGPGGCAKCHVPETGFSDRVAYPLPKVPPPAGFEDDPKPEFKTPPLRFVGGSPPYFHDGRYRTLEQLVDQNNDRMGKTNALSREDRAALVAFLRTL